MLCKIKEIIHNKKFSKPIIICLFIVALIVINRNRQNKDLLVTNIIPIEAASAKISELPIYVTALGTVTPEKIVNIKTQINGTLLKLAFEDGQSIKKDDLIAQIDPSIYQAQIVQYQGQLTRDQAILENSQLDLKRYQDLWKQNSVSKQTLDTQISTVKQNEGVVQLDQGLLETAKVNLSYCSITAPFDGQLGISNVSEGELVQSSDQSPIVTLTSVDPILVIFSVPEVDLPTIIPEFKKEKLIVEAYDQSFKNLLATGELVAIDNQIDTSTGTIKLKAEFKNSEHILFPNQFVNAKLLVKKLSNVIIVPSPAIQYGPSGTFVYLVDEDKTHVQVKNVTLGASSGTSIVITQGIEEGQMVATTGVDKLKDGAEITINNNGF